MQVLRIVVGGMNLSYYKSAGQTVDAFIFTGYNVFYYAFLKSSASRQSSSVS